MIRLSGRVLIVECERICSPEELRAVPEHNQIDPHFIDAIVEQPYGAYLAYANYYDYDYDWFLNYTEKINHKPFEEIQNSGLNMLKILKMIGIILKKVGMKSFSSCELYLNITIILQ